MIFGRYKLPPINRLIGIEEEIYLSIFNSICILIHSIHPTTGKSDCKRVQNALKVMYSDVGVGLPISLV